MTFFTRFNARLFTLAAAFALTAAIAAAPFAAAQAAQPPAFAAPATPAPDTAALAAITPAKYPDADHVIVDSATFTRYAADGSSRTHDTTLYKVLTEKGRRELRTRSFSYNAFYENFQIASVRILKPDGTAVSVDIAANSKEMIDRSMMGANIYDPNDKVVSLALPALVVGDAVEIVFDRTVKHSYMANTFFDLPT
ncbi:MAG: DUF3857 domain-containing protein, partial [Puniceicoccales bacterium]|nr:DUF3857 domain-containing protein [Puniceicoccales bacterium]